MQSMFVTLDESLMLFRITLSYFVLNHVKPFNPLLMRTDM